MTSRWIGHLTAAAGHAWDATICKQTTHRDANEDFQGQIDQFRQLLEY